MKSGIHPQWYPEAKVICNGSVVMTTGATKPEIHVEIWSGNHPFFTGQTRLLDTEGQVDRFMRRLQVREQIRTTQEEQKEAVDPTRWNRRYDVCGNTGGKCAPGSWFHDRQ